MIPFILAGIALFAGGYGVKKGIDAIDDYDTADSLNRDAQIIYDNAHDTLENARYEAQDTMEHLGKLKFQMYESSLIPFVNAFSKIKHVDFHDKKLLNELNLSGISRDEFLSIQETAFKMTEVVGGGIAALGAGGLAGLAAYGSVGFFASTAGGTAIGTLSGVAATNATLAWLGGGALSVGGFGMAGGMAVLGGIVAGPVLAIGGMMLASKAEEAKHNAHRNIGNARLAAEEMTTATVATRGIQQRFEEVAGVLLQLNRLFDPLLADLQRLVKTSTDYRTFSEEDRKGLMITAMLAKTIKNVLEVSLLEPDGSVTAASQRAMLEARGEIRKFQTA